MVAARRPAAPATPPGGPRPTVPARRSKEQKAVSARRRIPAILVVGLAAAGAIYLLRGPLRADDNECPEVEAPVAGPGGQVVEGDPDGDGCSTFGLFQLQTLSDGNQVMVLSIRVGGDQQQIALGRPDDQVVLGDWDCDGVDTPGLYQSALGQVQYFNVWPEVEQQQYRPDVSEPAPHGRDRRPGAGLGRGRRLRPHRGHGA